MPRSMPICCRSTKKASKGSRIRKEVIEEVEAKDQGLKIKIEEILTLCEREEGRRKKRRSKQEKVMDIVRCRRFLILASQRRC